MFHIDLDRFLKYWFLAHGCSTLHNAPVQHPAYKFDLGLANRYQKSLPPFGWDTEPVMGAEVVIEESFIDVFCDLVYGAGWIDIGRDQVDRESNWALVSFTSRD
jgi:hypothetical protein